MRTKRIWAWLTGLLLLCGCIEFEKQTLTYRYDPASDTLFIYQNYQGIFGATKKEALSDEETEQLKSVLAGDRTFFFNNWILEYDRSQLQERLGKLKEPQEGDGPRMDAAMIARQETLLKLLLADVKIVNGPLYKGEDGKLCGVQEVTVREFSKILAAANATIRDGYTLEAAKADTSAEDRAIYQKSTTRPFDYLKLAGNQIQVRLPMSRADYDKQWGPEADTTQLEALKRSGGHVAFANDELAITVGEPSAKLVKVTLPMAKGPYAPNVLKAVKEQTKILEKFDAEAAAAQFVVGKRE